MGTSATELGRIQSRFEEHRLFLRKRVLQPISIELSPGKKAWLYDLSEGGLRLYGGSGVELGTNAYIRFQFPEANSVVDASGVVAWSDPSGRAGVRFTHMQPESTASLRRWLQSGPEAAGPVATTNDDAVLASRISSLAQVSDLQAEISSRGLDRDAALDLIVRRMLEVTRATGAAIALREGGDVVCRASAGNAPDVGVKLSSSSLSGACFRTGTVVLLSDSESDPRVDPEICRQLNFRSLLVLPIITDDEAIGIAEVLSPNPRNFEGGDILVVSFLAEMVVSVTGLSKQPPEPQTQDVMSLLSGGEEAMTPQETVAVESLDSTSTKTEPTLNGLDSPPVAFRVPILAEEGPASGSVIDAEAQTVANQPVANKTIPAVLEPPVLGMPSRQLAEDRSAFAQQRVLSAVAGASIAAASPIADSQVRTARIPENALPASASKAISATPVAIPEFRPSAIRVPEPQKATWTLALTTAIVGLLISAGLLFSYHRKSAVIPAAATTRATSNAAKPTISAPAPVVAPAPLPAKSTAALKPASAPVPRHTVASAPSEPDDPGTEILVLHPASAVRPAPTPTTESPAPEAPKLADVGSRGLSALPAGITAATQKPKLQIAESQGVIAGRLIRKVTPHYPELALHAGVSGDVVLLAIIGTDGLLHNIKAISGSPMLREEAVAAAKQWRYSPATLSGKPVESDTRITINFHR